jgi:hypothetical protein
MLFANAIIRIDRVFRHVDHEVVHLLVAGAGNHCGQNQRLAFRNAREIQRRPHRAGGRIDRRQRLAGDRRQPDVGVFRIERPDRQLAYILAAAFFDPITRIGRPAGTRWQVARMPRRARETRKPVRGVFAAAPAGTP